MHSFRVCTNGLHSVCRQALLTEFVIVLIADFFLAQNASQIACFIPYRASTTGGELNNDSFVRRPLRPIAIFRAAEPTMYALPPLPQVCCCCNTCGHITGTKYRQRTGGRARRLCAAPVLGTACRIKVFALNKRPKKVGDRRVTR